MATDNVTLKDMVNSEVPLDRLTAANDPNISDEDLSKLAHDENISVRRTTVKHMHRMSIDDIKSLAKDDALKGDVAFYLGKDGRGLQIDISDAKKQAYGEILTELAKSNDDAVRLRVAGNINTPVDVLKDMSLNDKRETVRNKADSYLRLVEKEQRSMPFKKRNQQSTPKPDIQDSSIRQYIKSKFIPEFKDVVNNQIHRNWKELKDFVGVEQKKEAICNSIDSIKKDIDANLDSFTNAVYDRMMKDIEARGKFVGQVNQIKQDLSQECHQIIADVRAYNHRQWENLKSNVRTAGTCTKEMIDKVKENICQKINAAKNSLSATFSKAGHKLKDISQDIAGSCEKVKDWAIDKCESIRNNIETFDAVEFINKQMDKATNFSHNVNMSYGKNHLEAIKNRSEHLKAHLDKINYMTRRGGFQEVAGNVLKASVYKSLSRVISHYEKDMQFYKDMADGKTAQSMFKETAEANTRQLTQDFSHAVQTPMGTMGIRENKEASEFLKENADMLNQLNEKGNIDDLNAVAPINPRTERGYQEQFDKMVAKDMEYKQAIVKGINAGITGEEMKEIINSSCDEHVFGDSTLNSDKLIANIDNRIAEMTANNSEQSGEQGRNDRQSSNEQSQAVVIDMEQANLEALGNFAEEFEDEASKGATQESFNKEKKNFDDLSASEAGSIIAGGHLDQVNLGDDTSEITVGGDTQVVDAISVTDEVPTVGD